MASVAAATSHGRRARHAERVKQQARKDAKITRQRKELQGLAKEVLFEEDMTEGMSHSGDGGSGTSCTAAASQWLPQSELKDFFVAVLETRKLDPNAMQLVIDTATKAGGRNSQGDLEKQSLVEAIVKYHEYLGQGKRINSIMQKYGKGSDSLSRSQLLRLLQQQENKTSRAVNGISIKLVVSPKDMEAVFQQADICLLYTSPSPRDQRGSRMPSSA